MMHFCDLRVFSLGCYSHLFVHKDKIEYLVRKQIKASQLTPDKSLLNGPIYLFLLQLLQFFVFFKSLQVHFFWSTWLWWAVYLNLQINHPFHCGWHPWLTLNYTVLSCKLLNYFIYYSLKDTMNANTKTYSHLNCLVHSQQKKTQRWSLATTSEEGQPPLAWNMVQRKQLRLQS